MRIVGIDYGRKRVGVALSDANAKIAMPLKTLHINNHIDAMEQLQKLLAPHMEEIASIVIGMPLMLSGKKAEMAHEVDEFIKHLKKTFSLPIFTVDERFTSKIAQSNLREMGYKRKKRDAKADLVAATLILQGFLDKDE